MKLVKYINLVIGFLLFWTILSAQNLEQDLILVNKVFEEDSYMLEVSYDVYESYDAKQIYYSTKGEMYKNGIQNYQKIGDLEIIKNEHYTLTADHENKLIFILGAAYSEVGDQQEKALDPIKNALRFCPNHEFFKENESINGYYLWPEGTDYKKMKITYEKESHVLKEIVLYFNETEKFDESAGTINPKMVLRIENFNASPRFPDHCFSYHNFLVKNTEEQFELKPNFKQYTLKQALN